MDGMSALEIVEVGPRDGLQNEDAVLDVAARVAYIEALAAAGLRRIEAVSFVHPARVPQMAGAEAVMAAVPRPDGVRYSGLVLNAREMERAVARRGRRDQHGGRRHRHVLGESNQGIDHGRGDHGPRQRIAAAARDGRPAGDADGGRGVRLPVRGRGPAGAGRRTSSASAPRPG